MNGTGESKDESTESRSRQILQALQAVYDPRSTNELRQEATRYLEDLKSDPTAPQHGFGLASRKDEAPIVRHYGLSLIDYAVRFRWSDYSSEESQALREWIVHLAHQTTREDPPFVTNKISEIWVELAKRSWAVDWMDMDETLVQLWAGNTAQKDLVQNILCTLSDEVFEIDDSVVALRGTELNKACVDIFTPSSVLTEHFPNRETTVAVRYETEGWIIRMADALRSCVANGKVADDLAVTVLRVLGTYKSVVSWAVPNALVVSGSLTAIFSCLETDHVAIQLYAMEILHALYHRTKFSDDDFHGLVGPLLQGNTINLLRRLYVWLKVDPHDIDDDKYLLLKKFSEMLYNVGRLLIEKASSVSESTDIRSFLDLLLEVARSESLQVSIPALHLWAKMLAVDAIAKSPATLTRVGTLLELCSQRLLKYEALPQDAGHSSIIFLHEDIETFPERHAFLGNYSRFCNEIVELVVQQQPIDALYHILGQADQVLEHAYDGEPPFHPSNYTKNSMPFLKIDATFMVIEAALKGCLKWLTSTSPDPSLEHQQGIMLSNLEVWCNRLLGLLFEDPLIKERVLTLSVGFAVGPLRRNSQFAVRIFDKILETNCTPFPDSSAYTDAVRDLLFFSAHSMQRLAIKFSDHLVTIYDEIERKVNTVSKSVSSEPHVQARYTAILFIIMQRAATADIEARETRMQQMIQPIINQWQDKALEESLFTVQSFSKLLGLDLLQDYLLSRKVHEIEDWSSHPLDAEGKALQKNIQDAIDTLPLKTTKSFITVSVEKLARPSQPFDLACHFWQSRLPLILPNLLRLISLSQSYQDPTNWTDLPPEMASVVRHIFTDRFWQVGISQGSRDDFYARIGGTKSSLEGMASSVRATMRTIRECGYKILYCMSTLGDYFYTIPDLPGPLSHALFDDAHVLSPHQMSILVDMMKPIIEQCPPEQYSNFLPPILSAVFEKVDQKASSEWERIAEKHRAAGSDDDLSTEMKDESILRQLTMASVSLVVALVDPAKSVAAKPEVQVNGNGHRPASVREFVLRTPEILKPLILFCTHAIRMKDTRACTMIAKVFRILVPEFSGPDSIENDVREFISTEVLRACVTSLNDPYFVDMQKDFAHLIANILMIYSARTETPKQVLLSLPGMNADKVDRAVRHIFRAEGNHRQQRAVVLHLLEDYRGLTIDEQGKLPRPDPKKLKSKMQQKYTTTDMAAEKVKEESPDFGGVAEMFG